ncbi:CSC1-like protein ERD4 [Hibiscus syriacus]|uniref:CSC1-like protein ERD4 n=1 Tax=Hibiscus syriacus TaxID=106335 RepID=A0A6A2XIW0_HIBSY|nr:CSC1-like protein ERD4 [Hibiscus syriacus]
MEFSSFLTSLGTSFILFILLTLLFAWLSSKPGNSVVYYPNRILKGLEPCEVGSRTRNAFSWIREALSSTEQDVINRSRVDTAVYFVFLSTGPAVFVVVAFSEICVFEIVAVLGILVLSGIVLLPVLLPVAATDGGLRKNGNTTTSKGTFNDLDKLSMANIEEKSTKLANALMYPEVRPKQFDVLVRDLPDVTPGRTRKDQVDSVTAALAAQSLHAQMVDRWTVTEAPEPRQLMEQSDYQPIVDRVEIKTVLEAYIPQLAHIIFLALLPMFLLFLSKMEEIPSSSHVIRAASGKYFYFSVLNVFIGVTIGGTLFRTMKSIEKDPNSLVPLLAKSLPVNATFFLTFVALKFFVGYGLDLSQIVPLIIYHLKKKYLCKTEAEIRESWFPGDIGYATRVPNDMIVITIVLCYSVIAPVIIPFGVLYFALGWLVLRNQALRVYVPAYKSYGRMWPQMHNRIMSALLLYQVTMVATFGCLNSTTLPSFASQEFKQTPDMEQIFRSYIPPSLISEKQEDGQIEDAVPHVSRTGSSV